ncbi:MAG: glycosyltransferase [Bacteroidales bacterium]|nr:glycosyltransferase [Bacteroidales bacterium]
MKILISVDAVTGGAGNVAQILALHYAKRGEEVYLMFYHKKTTDSRYDLNKIHIIEQKKFNTTIPLINSVFHLNKLINEISPSIIISFLNTISPPILLSQLATKIPIIVSERSDPYNNTPHFKNKLLRYISYKRANLITVQFDVFKLFDKAAFRKGKVITIPNMILSPQKTKDYSYKTDIICFATIATLYSVKRLELMIELFSLINKRCPNTKLNIYGKGVDESKLKDLIIKKDLGNFVFLNGFINNVYDHLSENDIYLMTSIREGFPNSLSEAMAVGLPSVSFKCHEGLSELIQHNVNGYLIEEGDYDNFCEIAIQLVNNFSLRKQIGEMAALSVKKYGYDKIMKMWDTYVYSICLKNCNSSE